MVEIINKGKWVTQETIEKSFNLGQISSVDKIRCGSGFTTAFMKSDVPANKYSIIILPNLFAIQSKEQQHQVNPITDSYGNKLRVAFVYGNSVHSDMTVDEYPIHSDLVCFVADSFYSRRKEILSKSHRIHRILFDEIHSSESQSLYRKKLRTFLHHLEPYKDTIAIATVTATPNWGVENTHIVRYTTEQEPFNIDITHDFPKTIEKARELISKGDEYVLLGGNNVHIFKQCIPSEWGNVLKVKSIVAGNTLLLSLCEMFEIDESPEHKLMIYSSRGFEGGDLYEMPHTFLFEDLSKPHTTHSIGNVYQFGNRARGGNSSFTWCRATSTAAPKPLIKPSNVQSFIDDVRIPNEQKERSKSKYKDYINFIEVEGSHKKLLVRDDAAINSFNHKIVQNENIQRLIETDDYHKRFVEDRNIVLDFTDANAVKRTKMSRTGQANAVSNLLTNTLYISDRDLVNEHFVMRLNPRTEFAAKTDGYRKQLVKAIEQGRRRYNYDGGATFTSSQDSALELLKSSDKFEEFVDDCKKGRIKLLNKWKRSREISSKDYNIEIAKLDNKFPFMIAEVVGGLGVHKTFFKAEKTGWRSYGVLTTLSIELIEKIVKRVGGELLEVDIRSAFPRFLYSMCGLEFPDGFYGVEGTKDRYKKKIAVNVTLNSLWYDDSKATSKSQQRINNFNRLIKLGFATEVAEFALELAFDKPKSEMYSKLSREEHYFISKLKREIESRYGSIDDIHRRHDSILIVNRTEEFNNLFLLANNFEYRNTKGWLKMEAKDLFPLA